jgi:hypothetical protein
VDEVGKTPAKKMKQGPVQLHVGRVAYVQQVRGMCEGAECDITELR